MSRRGLELIKSFEGFRPRAERLDDGRWIIGHGHTLSAREGAQVGEAEAELLLRYDLLPILSAIDERVSLPLNQHQVDALASFGLNLGRERFLASEVLVWVNAGEPEDAARALAVHDEGAVTAPDPAARRRAAESALFRYDPAREADLAELLAAPVKAATETAASADTSGDARALAVAVLLGEAGDEAEASVPAAAPPETAVHELPVIVPSFVAVPPASPEGDGGPEPAARPDAANENGPEVRPEDSAAAAVEDQAPAEAEAPSVETEAPSVAEPESPASAPADTASSIAFHQPYAIEAVGPLMLEATPGDAGEAPAAQADSAPGVETLVLTSPPEVDPEPPMREVWPDGVRPGAAPEEEPLFIEDPELRMGGRPVFMPESFEPESGGRFDWNETGAFLGMGGVGLAAFGAAIVGFRMAMDRPAAAGLDQTAVAAWVLALIGALCVGISAYNLYLRWSRRKDG